jgi:hypothetical protein
MNAASLPDLARMADKLNLTGESPRAFEPAYEFFRPLSVYTTADFLPPLPARLSRRAAGFFEQSQTKV